MKKDSNANNRYYVCMEEWLYPAESGREYLENYDSYEDALRKAMNRCEGEMANFAFATGCDPTRPRAFISEMGAKQGVCITCENGLDEWWYAVKIITVTHGM